jgi:hypothetical protein
MCTVSNKLKLCTCKTKNAVQLKHYWVLKRHNGEQNCIIGQAILPANIGEQADKLNKELIGKLLNDGNCFDVELQHQENDILELHFSFKADPKKYMMLPCQGNYLAYAFKLKKGVWKKTDFDPFGENLNDIQEGKIINPFSKV